MEIICDVLRAIQEGSVKPTQIMHKSNLTWPVLMTHFEVLFRHQLLTRETGVSRTTYRLTAKGSAVLGIYLRLRDELDALEVEASKEKSRRSPVESVASSRQKNSTRSVMQSVLQSANFETMDDGVRGRSGARYHFDLVAKGLNESRYGFDVVTHATESDVIRVFVKQLDSDIPAHVIYSKSRSDVAKRVAASYSMDLVHARDFRRLVDVLAFRDALFSDRSVLLEADPSENYEFVLRELAEDEARMSQVSVFTWRGSPLYPVLPRGETVQVYLMTTQGAEGFTLRPRESLVPSYDESALLELLEGGMEKAKRETGLVIFDSLSELVVSLGSERTQKFLKRATGSSSADGRKYLFIVKRGYHDDRTITMIGDVFSSKLVYDAAGLKLDRTV